MQINGLGKFAMSVVFLAEKYNTNVSEQTDASRTIASALSYVQNDIF